MSVRENAPIGAPCWIDLMTSDVEKSRAFYAQLFGWESEDPNPDFGGYFNFTKDGGRVAGGMGSQPDMGPPNIWSVYLQVDDAEATVAAAKANGGTVYVEAMAVADLGIMGVVADPGGAMIGMWQPGLHRGFEVMRDPGTPSYFELLTRDYDASVAFYRDVFRVDHRNHWRQHPSSGTRNSYATIRATRGSWMRPRGSPRACPHTGRSTSARTTPMRRSTRPLPSVDPWWFRPKTRRTGKLATATDSTGAQFKLVAPNDQMPARD